jgi:hypothetical protein
MQLRSGTLVGNGIASISVDVMPDDTTAAAHTLVSLAAPDAAPITCSKQMSDTIGPLLNDIAAIVGDDRVLRRMPLIVYTFRMLARCDMERMVRSGNTRPVTIPKFSMVVLHKACELIHDIVEYVVREHPDCKDISGSDKHILISALTELDRTKWRMIHMIGGWIASADPVIGTALLDACAGNQGLTAIYRCIVNDSFARGSPPMIEKLRTT